ncbi:hypothetical protein [Streptomyces sp. NPDC005879]|uniref:hypothetical protein n=1 Tax=Streptomyces sp. NPDC005879 TaxID=3154567 RepID=UPI0033C636F2
MDLQATRLTLGVVTLTRQTLDPYGDVEEPGLITTVEGLPPSCGSLHLPAGPALYAVRFVPLTSAH